MMITLIIIVMDEMDSDKIGLPFGSNIMIILSLLQVWSC